MDLEGAFAYLDSHINREAVAGEIDGLTLEPMQRLLAVMGEPQMAYPVIHVTGTNGKGSVATMVSAILEAHGLSTGLLTSPHLERVNERIMRNREPLDDLDLAEAIEAVATVEALSGVTPSYFEILVAAGFFWFGLAGVDVAVVEVGLLGEFDATNMVDSSVAVVTNVGKDHTDGSGNWRARIAQEKAGIIKPESTAVIGPVGDDVAGIFLERSAEAHQLFGRDFELSRNDPAVGGRLVSVRGVHGTYDDLFVPVLGEHQGPNSAIAVQAVEAFFDRAVDAEVVEEGLSSLDLPGRCEVVGHDPVVVLDVAHNPDGMAALDAALGEIGVGSKRVAVVATLSGRNPTEMLSALGLGADDVLIATQVDSRRAVPAGELVDAALSLGVPASAITPPAQALQAARNLAADDRLVVVCGSTYLVGEMRALLSAL